jgi:plasmid stability protein
LVSQSVATILSTHGIGGEKSMPGCLNIGNLDGELIAKLMMRAARHGRSIEAEHREILRQALDDDSAAELCKRTAERKQPPSEGLLREERDER